MANPRVARLKKDFKEKKQESILILVKKIIFSFTDEAESQIKGNEWKLYQHVIPYHWTL